MQRLDLKSAGTLDQSRAQQCFFKPSFTSSEWCLDELVKIMLTRKEKGHRPFPVFYQLSTDDVANHLSSGWYKDDFDLHKKIYSYERVQSWSQALTSIADISGWVLSGDRSEVEMVEEISQKMLWNVHQLGRESSVVASGRMSLRFKTGTSAIDPEDEVGDASPPCNSNSAKEEENTIVEHQAHSTASAIPQEDAAGEEDGDHNKRLWMSRSCTATTSNKNDHTQQEQLQQMKFIKPETSPQGRKTARIPKTVAEEEIRNFSWDLSLIGQQLSNTSHHPQVNATTILNEAYKLWNLSPKGSTAT